MNFALCFDVAGLSRRAVRVAGTSPAAQVARWILFRWRTPPGTSDWLVEPLPATWRRLSVVALFPKASRKAMGKLSGSNDCSASPETASSISTAFMDGFHWRAFTIAVLTDFQDSGRSKCRNPRVGIRFPLQGKA
jgi:hypothetical protein